MLLIFKYISPRQAITKRPYLANCTAFTAANINSDRIVGCWRLIRDDLLERVYIEHPSRGHGLHSHPFIEGFHPTRVAREVLKHAFTPSFVRVRVRVVGDGVRRFPPIVREKVVHLEVRRHMLIHSAGIVRDQQARSIPMNL